MSTGEFLTQVGSWLLQEPVHKVLLLCLGIAQLILWSYIIVAHKLMSVRLSTNEVRTKSIMLDQTAQNSEIMQIRRDTQSEISQVRTDVLERNDKD